MKEKRRSTAEIRQLQKRIKSMKNSGLTIRQIWRELNQEGIKIGHSTVGQYCSKPLARKGRPLLGGKKTRVMRKLKKKTPGQISFGDLENKTKINDIYVELQPMLMQKFVDRKLLENEKDLLLNADDSLSRRIDLCEKQIVNNRTYSENVNDKLLGFLIWNVGLTIISFALFARSQGWL